MVKVVYADCSFICIQAGPISKDLTSFMWGLYVMDGISYVFGENKQKACTPKWDEIKYSLKQIIFRIENKKELYTYMWRRQK